MTAQIIQIRDYKPFWERQADIDLLAMSAVEDALGLKAAPADLAPCEYVAPPDDCA